jgi:hypothetical protein
MHEWFELWDTDAGNMIGAYETETEALAEVRGLLDENGSDYATDLALARRREDGGDQIAEGAALAHRALTGATAAETSRLQA